jgi:hypothetical protein
MDTQYSVNTGGVGNEDTNYQYDPVTQSYTGYDEAYLTDGETSAYAAVYGADQEYESPDEGHYLAATDGYTTTEEGVEDIPKDPQTVETKEEKSQKDSEAEKTSIQEGLQVSLNDTSSAPDTTDSKPEVGDGAYTNKRLKRIRAGRVKKRQDLLENEEEKKMLVVAAEAAAAASIARGSVVVPNENNQRAASRPLVGFIEREKAKINLQIKKAKAIARKRVPVQVRVFTDTRKRLSPLEKYFGGSVEPGTAPVSPGSLFITVMLICAQFCQTFTGQLGKMICNESNTW